MSRIAIVVLLNLTFAAVVRAADAPAPEPTGDPAIQTESAATSQDRPGTETPAPRGAGIVGTIKDANGKFIGYVDPLQGQVGLCCANNAGLYSARGDDGGVWVIRKVGGVPVRFSVKGSGVVIGTGGRTSPTYTRTDPGTGTRYTVWGFRSTDCTGIVARPPEGVSAINDDMVILNAPRWSIGTTASSNGFWVQGDCSKTPILSCYADGIGCVRDADLCTKRVDYNAYSCQWIPIGNPFGELTPPFHFEWP